MQFEDSLNRASTKRKMQLLYWLIPSSFQVINFCTIGEKNSGGEILLLEFIFKEINLRGFVDI